MISKSEKENMFRQLMWDYTIPEDEIEQVFSGKKIQAGHYTREKLLTKLLETYPWFTILQLFTPEEIKSMLTEEVVKNLRMPSLRKKYEFIQQRLQELIPYSK